MSATPRIPPTTPPTIGPVLELLLGEGETEAVSMKRVVEEAPPYAVEVGLSTNEDSGPDNRRFSQTYVTGLLRHTRLL
jgi:hypothetical protein